MQQHIQNLQLPILMKDIIIDKIESEPIEMGYLIYDHNLQIPIQMGSSENTRTVGTKSLKNTRTKVTGGSKTDEKNEIDDKKEVKI